MSNPAFFIYELYQTGNVGSHNTKRYDEQPEEGFKTINLAEKYLSNCIKNKNQWKFKSEGHYFTILKVYQSQK